MSTGFHCGRCGARNEIEERRTSRFDIEFGWPIYETRYVCPNKRLPFDGHAQSRWEGRAVNPKYVAEEQDAAGKGSGE